MNRINFFSDCVILEEFFNPEVDEEILKILKEEEQKNKSVTKSNQGGFQTNPIDNELICLNILKKSVKILGDNFKFRQKTKFELKNLWINKNEKNNFNTNHVHPGSEFSGVYYLSVPKKNGELVFLRNDTSAYFNKSYDFIDDQVFYDRFIVYPKKRSFILFPSHLNHFVNPHYEDMSRISVSFNIGFLNG
jgi:uncharacterized protein (TIGR02466 family)